MVFLLRLRAVSYYSLQSYCTPNPSTRAAINEGVSSRRKVPIPYCYITSWFAIALAEIRTRRIKREKADCKQSILDSFLDWISLSVTLVISRPESSLSVNMQVDRKILGAKIEILNCLLVVCTRKWSFKIVFRKLNCSTATKAALVKNHITLTPRFRPITLIN